MWQKFVGFFLTVCALLGLSAQQALAALDASVTTSLNGIQTDATTLNGLVTPVMITVLGFIVILKLIKRFGNKI